MSEDVSLPKELEDFKDEPIPYGLKVLIYFYMKKQKEKENSAKMI